MKVRRWLGITAAALLCGLLNPPAASAAPAPVVTVNPDASAFAAYDPSPDSVGLRFPTVSVSGSVDQCLPEFRSWSVTMTQNGKTIEQVWSGANSEGQIENCNAAGGVDLGGMFGGDQLVLRPGTATVTFSVYGVEDGPLAVGTGTVIIPPRPMDGKITIIPVSTPVKKATEPGTATPTNRIRVGAVITDCTPGVTYTLAAAALPYKFARTAAGEVDHPVTCPRSGYKAVVLPFYDDTFAAGKKASFLFLLTGPNGLNWSHRNVTIPRRR